jgi:peroxiredoxin
LNARHSRYLPGPGDAFPVIVGRDCDGRSVEAPPANAVVLLYRGQWCAHCRAQLLGLAREASGFAAIGFRLIAISSDDVSLCQVLRDATGGAIEIVSDVGAGFISDLALVTSDPNADHPIAQPAVFIIDGDGVVRYRYVSRSAEDRPKTALLLLAAERVASGGAHVSTARTA